MSGSSLPFAHPPHAVIMWTDDINIYVELPTTMGNPYITKYPVNEGGLSKALNILRTRYEELPSAQKNYTAPAVVPSLKNGKPPVQTEVQRAQALNVLRKLGLV